MQYLLTLIGTSAIPRYISGQCRTQATLFPEVLDDFISDENPIRVIDVFISELVLDISEFQRVTPKDTGRPGYSPAIMMKLYLYGYLNRIQSSRRLERETLRNIELMWLLELLSPVFKIIADCRRDNAKRIKNVCRTFVQLCRKMDIFI
ncbi:MAG: transposase [Oleiphilaceae bacterium]|jgi:transposase